MSDIKEQGLSLEKGFKLVKNEVLRFEAPVVVMGALEIFSTVSIGAFSYLQSGRVRTLASMGRYCSIGPNVSIGELNHPTDWLSCSPFQYKKSRFGWYDPAIGEVAVPLSKEQKLEIRKSAPVIGNDVWMGTNVTVMRGVTIGNGAVIAAGAIVNRDVDDFEIVAGIPAKRIRHRFPEEIRKRLLELRWWDYDCRGFGGVDFSRIDKALDEIEARIRDGRLVPMVPVWKVYMDGGVLSPDDLA